MKKIIEPYGLYIKTEIDESLILGEKDTKNLIDALHQNRFDKNLAAFYLENDPDIIDCVD
jgi:hypothetical protein